MLRKSVACAALFATSFDAAALDVSCPEKITTSQTLLKQESGWQQFIRPVEQGETRQWAYVSGISLYTGNPKELAQLKPDDETAKKSKVGASAHARRQNDRYTWHVFTSTLVFNLSKRFL